MALKYYKAKAPGSLMLFGEHAVLTGKTALVGSINQYITVTLTPRCDNVIHIISGALGEYITNLNDLASKTKDDSYNKFKFVLTAIFRNKNHFEHGFDLLIEADFLPTVGFGSSAAVTVATLATLHSAIYGTAPNKLGLFYEASAIVQSVQKMGSGADVAASIFGGILVYRRTPLLSLFIEKLPNLIPITIVYSGNKVATPLVVKQVQSLRINHLEIFDHIYEAIDKCSKEAALAIKNYNLQTLGSLMNIHQGLQDALGVNNARLSELIFALRSHKSINGAKISGAGLGDCVIGLGKASGLNDFEQIEASFINQGLDISMS